VARQPLMSNTAVTGLGTGDIGGCVERHFSKGGKFRKKNDGHFRQKDVFYE